MDRDIKSEIVTDINRMKKLLKLLADDGDITKHEHNTVMKHLGALKSVLRESGRHENYAVHVMRMDRMNNN